MTKALIIVESPAKTRTLQSFLGKDYNIQASMGHVRDLPQKTLGIDINNNFTPEYKPIPERKDVINNLKAAAKKADTVYLASDPDREGEAISWHLKELLKLDNAKRITFNEITKQAVTESLKHPMEINMNLVNAQQARRLLDRVVGYMLSPLLWKKIQKGLSGGRVQSVAVRLVCDREREIQGFVPREYWTVSALFATDKGEEFEAQLALVGKKKPALACEADAAGVLESLKGASYIVNDVKKTASRRSPALPFVTSTLEQEASRKLGMSTSRTMSVAQQLYEGIDLGGDGHVGLITYMRTDSTRIAESARDEAKKYIRDTYGAEYSSEYRSRNRTGAQDAHEAIRPTSILREPSRISQYLTADQRRLYKLIWQRFLSSQMAPAVYDVFTANIRASDCVFRATGSRMTFPGFTKVYVEDKDDQTKSVEELPPLPAMKEGDVLQLKKLIPGQHFTEPPARYTEATLVKTMEANGIGRPSTYHAIIYTILDRGYVTLEDKRFRPTELGVLVNDKLCRHFPDILDVEYTANVENQLDMVGEGSVEWTELLGRLYAPFKEELDAAQNDMEPEKPAPKVSEEKCPKCGKPMVVRSSRYGEFLGCSDYPRCKEIIPLNRSLGVQCPKCGGDIVEKKSRKGKVFYGCSRYPECDFVSWDKPTDKKCPVCGSMLCERRYRNRLTGYTCIKPGCGYTVSLTRKPSGSHE
ncbi:MAG: type I DNA topoisomerase [Abditibacteriota bacterium]|nr:type I DNA topoisomerase [Abditibacteriota bacterium]